MRIVTHDLSLSAYGRGADDGARGERFEFFVRGVGFHDDDVARVFAFADDA